MTGTTFSAPPLAGLGPVMQMSFCPADFDGTLAHWIALGAGPFFARDHVRLENVRYMGAPSDIDFSMVIGYFGDMQIEIVRQHNDAPSMFRDWRMQGHEGVQHLCVLVDDLADARQRSARAGGRVIQEAALPGGAGGVIYVDFGGGPGTVMEFLQISPAGRAGFAAMQAAHRTWDGRDPVRTPGR